jgi:hypothetical protein
MNSGKLNDLSLWWAVGIPAAMLVLTLYAYFTSPELMMLLIRRDEHPDGGGIAENGTVLVLLPGIAAGIAVLWNHRQRLPWWLVGWLLGWVLACIYFAGEEASWGQHYLRWATPETLQSLNDQNETNLHNVSHWLDQKPRSLVELWMVFAGLLAPLIRRLRPTALWAERDWARWFWPTRIAMPTTIAFLLSLAVAIIAKKTGRVDLHQLGSNELREFYLAVFLSGYLLSLWHRLRQTA